MVQAAGSKWKIKANGHKTWDLPLADLPLAPIWFEILGIQIVP